MISRLHTVYTDTNESTSRQTNRTTSGFAKRRIHVGDGTHDACIRVDKYMNICLVSLDVGICVLNSETRHRCTDAFTLYMNA